MQRSGEERSESVVAGDFRAEGPGRSRAREPRHGEIVSKARGGGSIINYMAQGRLDLAMTARVLSQRIASPTTGTGGCLRRAISHLASYPNVLRVFPRGPVDETSHM